MKITDSRVLDVELVKALDRYHDSRAAIDRIPEARVEDVGDPHGSERARSRSPVFTQASDTGHGCRHPELILRGSVDAGPTIACAKCFKRWCRPGAY